MSTADNSEQNTRKVRITALIEPEQREKLEALSSATGAPLCELVRRSLNSYFSARQELERVSA